MASKRSALDFTVSAKKRRKQELKRSRDLEGSSIGLEIAIKTQQGFASDVETAALMLLDMNCVHKVEAHLTKLDKKNLEEIRSTDRDVKAYIVGVLRDIQSDINISLVELGPGPIMEASGGE